jgi:hypothetical protein
MTLSWPRYLIWCDASSLMENRVATFCTGTGACIRVGGCTYVRMRKRRTGHEHMHQTPPARMPHLPFADRPTRLSSGAKCAARCLPVRVQVQVMRVQVPRVQVMRV